MDVRTEYGVLRTDFEYLRLWRLESALRSTRNPSGHPGNGTRLAGQRRGPQRHPNQVSADKCGKYCAGHPRANPQRGRGTSLVRITMDTRRVKILRTKRAAMHEFGCPNRVPRLLIGRGKRAFVGMKSSRKHPSHCVLIGRSIRTDSIQGFPIATNALLEALSTTPGTTMRQYCVLRALIFMRAYS